jgi:hypothetical protein
VEPVNWWLPAHVKAGTLSGCFNSGLGYQLDGFFLLVMDLRVQALLDELVCLPLIESILSISPMADL